jgi:hypothetical protein
MRDEYRVLVERVLHGPGSASPEQRAAAFAGDGTGPPLLGKVATSPAQITDADLDGARAAGLTDEQLVELVICAAVGQATRLYEAGLAALDEATR